MDGILMSALHGNLNKLSDKNWKKLLQYFETGTLTLPAHYSILSEIIGLKATSLVLKVPV
jgi:hypothetical protein